MGEKQLDHEDAYSPLFVPKLVGVALLPFPPHLHNLSLKHRDGLTFTLSFSFSF
jgi:hypothetical protein